MGVGTILAAREIIMMAFGEHKARIVAQAVEGEITPVVAASFLQEHPNAHVILDEAASAELTRTKSPWVLGWVPTEDNYFLGQLQFDDGPALRAFGDKPRRGVMLRLMSDQPNVGNAFATMVAPDWQVLDRKRYEFTYVRREFLGESRCFVFDVQPLKDVKQGFVGRIWIEDRDFNLVRFNGANRGSEATMSGLLKRNLSFHMDG